MLEQLDDLGFVIERPSGKACYQCYQAIYQCCCAVTPRIFFLSLMINSVVCILLGFYLGRESMTFSFGDGEPLMKYIMDLNLLLLMLIQEPTIIWAGLI